VSHGRVHVYKDGAGKWRWRTISSSDIVSESGQGYVRRGYCARMAAIRNPDAELVFDDK
jgi:uncharacterized protein YegP (UPF0339 family)